MLISRDRLIQIMAFTSGTDIDLSGEAMYPFQVKRDKLIEVMSKSCGSQITLNGDNCSEGMKKSDSFANLSEDEGIKVVKVKLPSFDEFEQQLNSKTDVNEIRKEFQLDECDKNELKEKRDHQFKANRIEELCSAGFHAMNVDDIEEEKCKRSKYDKVTAEEYKRCNSSLNPSALIGNAYKKVLDYKMSYLEFLKLNPQKFLELRVQWKLNKFIGFKGIRKGAYFKYYRNSFEELYDNGKVAEFLKVFHEAYPSDVEMTGNNFNDFINSLHWLTKDWGKVLFILVRPEHIKTKPLKETIAKTLIEFSKTKFGEELDIHLNGNKDFKEYIENIDSENNTLTYLIQPDYKDVVNHIRMISIGRKLTILNDFMKGSYEKSLTYGDYQIFIDILHVKYDHDRESDLEYMQEVITNKVTNIMDKLNEKHSMLELDNARDIFEKYQKECLAKREERREKMNAEYEARKNR